MGTQRIFIVHADPCNSQFASLKPRRISQRVEAVPYAFRPTQVAGKSIRVPFSLDKAIASISTMEPVPFRLGAAPYRMWGSGYQSVVRCSRPPQRRLTARARGRNHDLPVPGSRFLSNVYFRVRGWAR